MLPATRNTSIVLFPSHSNTARNISPLHEFSCPQYCMYFQLFAYFLYFEKKFIYIKFGLCDLQSICVSPPPPPVKIPEPSFMKLTVACVWEQSVEENIWTKKRWSDGRLEKTA
jgi:hypothetical protein